MVTHHAKERYVERIDSNVSVPSAKYEILEAVKNGLVITHTDHTIVVRYLDSLYVVSPSNDGSNRSGVMTTLNHYMDYDNT